MSDKRTGVGVNGEPDDFAARYDRMVVGGGGGWVLKTILALVVLLVLIGVGRTVIGL